MQFDGPLLDGRWQLGPRLGKGNQAHTYLAKDTTGKEDVVVVKQIQLGKNADWKGFDLFEREARVLKALRHPGIPRYLAHFESSPGVFNLVMERKPGPTLRAMSTRVRFSTAELRDILGRVLAILDYLHRLSPPVIHRDIKPGNLVRAADGAIALVDFGGVRDAVREGERGGSTMVGTFGYMAPEQLHGQATGATDIYALGATIVALAGGVDPEEVPRKGLRMDLPRHLPDLEPALRGVLEKMTEPDPEQRPQSARDVLALLAAAPGESPAKSKGKSGTGASRAAETLALPPAPQLPAPLWSQRLPVPGGGPLGLLLRVALFTFSLAGSLSLTVMRTVIVPIVFMIVHAIAGARHRAALTSARDEISHALAEGSDGFTSLRRRALGQDEPRRLPPA
jgi:serine/threonine protein kinase